MMELTKLTVCTFATVGFAIALNPAVSLGQCELSILLFS